MTTEKIFIKLRNGPNKHLYTLSGKVVLSRGIGDIEFITTTDLRLFARQYRINIFVYYDSGDGEQPFYLGLNGTRHGVRYGGIFLKFQIVEGVPHCLIVWRCKPKEILKR